MAGLFEHLFSSGSKPVRRDAHLKLTIDADGNPVIEGVSGEAVTLSPEGSIDRVKVSADRHYHCGCNAEQPMGGQCAEPGCRRISCVDCFHRARCQACLKPCCLEHGRFMHSQEGRPVRLCFACYDALIRKRRLRAIVKGVLRPFVVFDERRET